MIAYQYITCPIIFIITWLGSSILGRIFAFIETSFWITLKKKYLD